MIGRLLDTAASLLVYALAATLVAELIIAAYLWWAWQLDAQKLARIVAAAQGAELAGAASGETAPDEAPPEEVSYQAIVDRRARLFRDLELRELALTNAIAQLAFDRRQLAESQAEQTRLVKRFQTELAAVQEGAEAAGREVVRSTLQSLQPAQAKQQLFEMLEAGEIDEVVLLLADMPASNRGKILAAGVACRAGQKPVGRGPFDPSLGTCPCRS
jgi:hypothetical protein